MAEAIALIDYGAGNLHSVHNALIAAGAERVVVTADPAIVHGARRIVLPGVGSFKACADGLWAIPGLVETMEERVIAQGVPFLGVCVGMQLLATRGLEFGETPGLDWIEGDVVRMEPANPALKVPHMGWNALEARRDHPLLEGEPEGAHMYFTHSFALKPANPEDVVAFADHGGVFVAAVARGNVAGVQFHPEKSQAAGLKLLSNFLEWRP